MLHDQKTEEQCLLSSMFEAKSMDQLEAAICHRSEFDDKNPELNALLKSFLYCT